jgi:hypothetical protein
MVILGEGDSIVPRCGITGTPFPSERGGGCLSSEYSDLTSCGSVPVTSFVPKSIDGRSGQAPKLLSAHH